jgi:hypothetical protein
MRRSLSEYVARGKQKHGDKFDTSDLNPEFIEYFENGARIEVENEYQVRRGTVGVTTGWRPCFLLMARCNCHSSSDTIGKTDRVTRVIKY